METHFQTKVITIVGGEKYQYFHYHKGLGDVIVEGPALTIRLEIDTKYVSYPLCNVERWETEIRKGR